MQRGPKPEPLEGHPRYEKVGLGSSTAAALRASATVLELKDPHTYDFSAHHR